MSSTNVPAEVVPAAEAKTNEAKPELAKAEGSKSEPTEVTPAQAVLCPIQADLVTLDIDVVEAEGDDYTDADSTLGTDRASSTASVSESIFAYRQENGRTYHAYKDGAYLAPNDEIENDRLDLQHHLMTLTLDGKLLLAPVPKDQTLHRVIDVGCGTGIWAMDFADDHPESQVLGCDLSPIQPGYVPPNLRFEVDDIEADWLYHDKWDLIHSSQMTGSLKNWPRFFSQAFENLAPGGWIEIADPCFPAVCLDGTMPADSKYNRWLNYLLEATRKVGRDCDSAKSYKAQMEAAGFENVTERVFVWPTNGWPKDKKLKLLGQWHFENYGNGLESLSLAIFTRILGWSVEEMMVFLATVRNEMKDTRVHSFIPYHVVYAQKPKTAA